MKVSDLRLDRSIPKTTVVARRRNGMVIKYPEAPQDFDSLMQAHAEQFKRSVKEETQPEYFKRLQDELGIKRLGKGAFSHVFQHPTHPDVAVKVFTSSDEAYAAYLRYVQKRQHNKYLPKILSVHEHTHVPSKDDTRSEVDRLVDDKYTIVFMEKLRPATEKDVQVFLDHVQDLIGVKYTSMQAIGEKWQDLADQTQDPDLAQLAKAMVVMNNRYFVDLRGEKNVMMRGKQIVFTDPVS